MVLRLAHEIRNPLATIKSAVQLMQHLNKAKGQNSQYFNSILTQVGRIDNTVIDMQRFARIENEQPQDVSVLHEVVRSVKDHSEEADKGEVSLVIVEGPDVSVQFEPTNFQTALRELLSNAIRFTPAEGEITVSWKVESDRVLLHVDDQGPGIKKELGDRIFRPFFSTSTQGTGLGLNIVLKICQMAGGGLEWENLPSGRGCRFTMIIQGVQYDSEIVDR